MKKNITLKHKIALILSSLSILLTSINSYADTDNIIAPNAVAIEANTGELLFGKNENDKIYPASTTKVWTAYLTLKYCTNIDNTIEIKKDLSWIEPSSMFLK